MAPLVAIRECCGNEQGCCTALLTASAVSTYTLGSMINEAAVARREAPVDMNVLRLIVFIVVMVHPHIVHASHNELHSPPFLSVTLPEGRQ